MERNMETTIWYAHHSVLRASEPKGIGFRGGFGVWGLGFRA